MLCLTRKKKEAIIFTIGETKIVVRVLGTSAGRVRLGVVADESVSVVREELEPKQENENGRV